MATITVFLGTIRRERQGHKVGAWIKKKLEERNHVVHLIDPAEHTDIQVLTDQYKTTQNPSEDFKQLQRWVEESEGYIVITPEYNHGYSGALKNALDCFLEEYYFKPFSIVTYSAGGFGGVRAAEQLRGVLAEFSISTPIAFTISHVQQTFDKEGGLTDNSYDERIVRFLNEFEWYIQALSNQRTKGTPY